mgnify:CR=1 FL=1
MRGKRRCWVMTARAPMGGVDGVKCCASEKHSSEKSSAMASARCRRASGGDSASTASRTRLRAAGEREATGEARWLDKKGLMRHWRMSAENGVPRESDDGRGLTPFAADAHKLGLIGRTLGQGSTRAGCSQHISLISCLCSGCAGGAGRGCTKRPPE